MRAIRGTFCRRDQPRCTRYGPHCRFWLVGLPESDVENGDLLLGGDPKEEVIHIRRFRFLPLSRVSLPHAVSTFRTAGGNDRFGRTHRAWPKDAFSSVPAISRPHTEIQTSDFCISMACLERMRPTDRALANRIYSVEHCAL
jgi:hypothetical protein